MIKLRCQAKLKAQMTKTAPIESGQPHPYDFEVSKNPLLRDYDSEVSRNPFLHDYDRAKVDVFAF